jgi:hypothetical protein
MIKKTTLLVLTCLLVGLGSQAQSLVNTAWAGNFQGTPINVRFTATDIEIAGGGNPFTAVATFTETPSTMSLVDIDPASCGTDTGVYSLTFSTDTLIFGVVSETCTPRSDFFTSGPFTQTNISVFEAAKFNMTKLFPNPAKDVINLDVNGEFAGNTYVIYNIQGQTVSSGQLISGENRITISGLKSGLYQIHLKDNVLATLKFVKL